MIKKNNILELLDLSSCTGCLACIDACPKSCLRKEEKDDGFVYPSINQEDCINCGLCVKVCPAIKSANCTLPQKVLAAYSAKEIRMRASSGGIFEKLAECVLKQSGNVWGASFDSNLILKHTCAKNLQELFPLFKSKYIQSDTSGVFEQIKKDLRDKIVTLFVGTPCQCAALKKYINSNCEYLYLVDLVCHGVPSQSFFNKYIKWEEERINGKINSFIFRYKSEKTKHLQSFKIKYTRKNRNREKVGLHYESPYYFGFQKYITLRESCYSCIYAKPERVGDITLGDFWGVEKYLNLDVKEGVSMVLINTTQGQRLFDLISMLQKQIEVSYEIAKKNNSCLVEPTKKRKERILFVQSLKKIEFDTLVSMFLKSKNELIFKIYYFLPKRIRRVVRKLMEGKMKYE